MAQLEETDSANADVIVDGLGDSASAPPTSAGSKAKSAPASLKKSRGEQSDEDNNSNDDDDEEAEEYEIEAILDAKRNVVKQGEYSYLVKWKGYGPEHNSWVNESDAQGCRELIEEFFRIRAKSRSSKPFRRINKMTTGKPKGQTESSSTIKRGRGSRASAVASKTPEAEGENEDEEEEDEDEMAKRSKRRKRSSHAATNGSASTASAKAARRGQNEDDNVSMEDATNNVEDAGEMEIRYTSMKDIKLGSEKNWEKYVKEITTVEREGKDLMIFFETIDNHYVREPSSKCAQRFPQKLIKFYESHLRWKVNDEEVES